MDNAKQLNLDLMKSRKEGGLEYELINNCSIGSAGTFEEHDCGGTEYAYNSQTGQIHYFGNVIPAEMRNLPTGYMCIAVNAENMKTGQPWLRVVKFRPPPEATRKAQEILEETVKAYNKSFGFKIN